MAKNIVIVGSGGLSREVEWLIKRINNIHYEWNILGFIDNDNSGNCIVGDDKFLLEVKEEIFVAIAIGNSEIRKNLSQKYKRNSKLKFPNLVDPSVNMSSKVKLGEGNIICAGSILTVDISLSDFIYINLDCTIGHDAQIEDFVTVNPGVNISGNVIIGECSEIGTGTKIIQGKNIGKNVIIGAGAVVIDDILDNSTSVGVPAKVIKVR